MVRLYRTFSSYFGTGETRFAGCFYTSSACTEPSSQKKRGVQGARTQGRGSEPPRTFSNHMTTERAGRVAVFHRRLGWFACTEPSLATSLQGKQGVQGARARVGGGSRTSNLLDSNHTDLLWKPSIHTLFTLR